MEAATRRSKYCLLHRPPSKYRNKKVVIDGYTFDSLKEGERYRVLKQFEIMGTIKHLTPHPRISLHLFDSKGCPHSLGRRYTPDFSYYDVVTGEHVLEDVKSQFTAKDRAFCLILEIMAAMGSPVTVIV